MPVFYRFAARLIVAATLLAANSLTAVAQPPADHGAVTPAAFEAAVWPGAIHGLKAFQPDCHSSDHTDDHGANAHVCIAGELATVGPADYAVRRLRASAPLRRCQRAAKPFIADSGTPPPRSD